MTDYVFSGKTAEEAVEAGLQELGLKREEVQIEVLEEGKRKLFGSIPAQVRLTPVVKKTDGERAVEFLEGLIRLLGQDTEVTLLEEDEKIAIDLSGSDRSLIGRRGEVIDSLQTLAGAVANIGREQYVRVVVDHGGYREERENTLKHVAEKMAAKAVRLGKRVRLEPMNPYERRIIHAALVDSPDVTTKSEGKEPTRFVVIIPNNLKSFDRKDRMGRGNDRGRGRDNRSFRKGGDNNRDRKDNRFHDKDKKPYQKRELPKDGTPQTTGTSLNRGGGTSGFRKGGFSGFFGTYLGNSRDDGEGVTPETNEDHSEE